MLVGTDTILLCIFLSHPSLMTTTEFGVTLSQVRIKIHSVLCGVLSFYIMATNCTYLCPTWFLFHTVGMNLIHLYAFTMYAFKAINFPLNAALVALYQFSTWLF